MTPVARRPGRINGIGLWTLYLKEVRRFGKVWSQTLLAPLVTALLFQLVFSIALGGSERHVGDIPWMLFLAPGLVMMSVMQNAFANSASSLVISKVQGNIVDVLMPPLSPLELAAGYALGGVTRGLAVGAVTAVCLWLFWPVAPHSIGFLVFHAVMASLMLAVLGIMTGQWSEKFDHMFAITNFIITPLSFLSGTFYSASHMPEGWRFLVHLNPFYYLMDGFRYGWTGHTDGGLWTGIVVVSGVTAVLCILCCILFARGYRLKA